MDILFNSLNETKTQSLSLNNSDQNETKLNIDP